uniref:putative ABC transporter permease n=1 Tax=Ndongobacter massiliensis TaxID=1871025 RepID=UPI00092FEE10|nr:putative ABC transporter permease [Ndongobacter massiliensis]
MKNTSLLIYFFLYAFLGWMMEVSYSAIKTGQFVNAGMLNGPCCPIYGFGAIAVIEFLSDIAQTNKLFLFFGSMFIASLIELITGFLLEKIVHRKWWDYSDRRLNVGGYICLEYSLLWGMCCFVLYEAVHPIVQWSVGIFPKTALLRLNALFAVCLFIDFLGTVNTLTGLHKKWKLSQKIGEDMRKVSEEIGKKVYAQTMELDKKRQAWKNSDSGKAVAKTVERKRQSFWLRWNAFNEKRLLRAFPNLNTTAAAKRDKKKGLPNRNPL